MFNKHYTDSAIIEATQFVVVLVCAALLGLGLNAMGRLMFYPDAGMSVVERADGSFDVADQVEPAEKPVNHDLVIAKLRSRLWLSLPDERRNAKWRADWQAEYDAAVAARELDRRQNVEEEQRMQREADSLLGKSEYRKAMDAYAERTAQAVLQDTLKGLQLRTVK